MGRGICISLKIDLIQTKYAVRMIITTTWVTCVQKNSKIRFWIKQLLAKHWFFKKLAKIVRNHKNLNFSSIVGIFLDQLLLPYKFHGSGMRGIFFFQLYQLWVLNALFPKFQPFSLYHLSSNPQKYQIWIFLFLLSVLYGFNANHIFTVYPA